MTLHHVKAGHRPERVDVPPVLREDPPICLQRLRVLIQPFLAPGLALEGWDVVAIEPQRFHESDEGSLVIARGHERRRFPDRALGGLWLPDGRSRGGPRHPRIWRLDGR